MRHVANVSFGKDSTAMVLRLLEEHWPLDEVIFYNTGMEFDSVYSVRDAVVPLIREAGVAFTELSPERPFLYDMLARPVEKRNGSYVYGYGWCGGKCRWGTANKREALNKHQRGCSVYLGIALDEPERLARLKEGQSSPLAQWGMTEADCLAYCYDHGIRWMEGDVDLYEVLDRVSCWCCANKNKRELRAMHDFLPEYWRRLKALQVRISERPMKRFKSRAFGDYGNVLEMERVFELDHGLQEPDNTFVTENGTCKGDAAYEKDIVNPLLYPGDGSDCLRL